MLGWLSRRKTLAAPQPAQMLCCYSQSYEAACMFSAIRRNVELSNKASNDEVAPLGNFASSQQPLAATELPFVYQSAKVAYGFGSQLSKLRKSGFEIHALK